MLTIIASMERELTGVRRVLARQPIANGPSGNAGLQMHVIGVGKAHAEHSVRSLLSSSEASGEPRQGLLLLGFAGGVDPDLNASVLALAPRYLRTTGGDFLEADPQMLRLAVQAAGDAGLPCTRLDSLTVDRVVSTTADKQAVYRQYQVGTVHMEDYHLARLANSFGFPFLAVRAVLDPANQGLAPYVLAMSRSIAIAALGTAVRPWRIPPLIKLARRMRLAQDALSQFALAYLNRWYYSENAGCISTQGGGPSRVASGQPPR